jgi:hypothetical protein
MATAQRKPTARKSTLKPIAPNAVASDTVTVACKLPHGVVLRLFDVVPRQETRNDGTTTMTTVAVEREETRVVIKGTMSLLGKEPRMPTVFDFAITPGVPRRIWEEWLSQMAGSDMVKNRLIFASETSARASDEAKEYVTHRTGLEPVDQANPQKHVRGIESGVRNAA